MCVVCAVIVAAAALDFKCFLDSKCAFSFVHYNIILTSLIRCDCDNTPNFSKKLNKNA